VTFGGTYLAAGCAVGLVLQSPASGGDGGVNDQEEHLKSRSSCASGNRTE
jgi:hypothetical protein